MRSRTLVALHASLVVLVSGALACTSADPVAPGDGEPELGDGTGDGSTSSATGAGGGQTGSSGAGASPGSGGGGDVGFVPCPHADFAAKFDSLRAALEADLAQNGVLGGALAVVCESEILAAGVGVVRAGGPNVGATTRFQLASLTKMLTATAALSLADEHVVEIGAPIGAVMPQLAYGSQVTLEHLLTHTSGLPLEFAQYPTEQLVPLVLANANLSPSSTPGSSWDYNNAGYAILGAAMETASSTAFDALVHDRVFSPIGMAHATMRVSEVLSGGDHSWGHSSGDELGPQDSYYGAPWYGPMGGAWASADDVALYARSLLGNGPLAERLAVQAIKRVETGTFPGDWYGYGLGIDESLGPPIVYHSGSVQGFVCDMEVVPSAGIAAVVLANDDAYWPMQVALQAIDAFVPLSY